ncbi:uncharacterized protein LOC143445353 isoform X2 [Clavelina lepadiformis]|uniref:uncharacterized protein LOC143445353 isoform X2 n=1 Tax=Clavelina lepadiformis TaxID=159417 RepID=UPI004041DB14
MPDSKGHNDHIPALEIIKGAEDACNNGDFQKADQLYTRALQEDPKNPSLYGNRSVVRVHLRKYENALSDAKKCLTVDPSYTMGYFRQGVALQCLGRYYSALTAFSKGMARDRKNVNFLKALIEAALKSPLKESLATVMTQLKEMNLENNPFVITSVIGQDILAHNDPAAAVEVLECAISIGSSSLKLKGSVYSALSSALWSMENYERAIHYMTEDLKISQALSDAAGECRAYGNLGAAHLSLNHLDEALANYRKQLSIAQELKNYRLIAASHSGLGMVYTALGDHKSALQHHDSAVEICSQTQDLLMKCRELGKVAQAKLALGDKQGALRCQKDRLRFCSDGLSDGGYEEAQAYTDVSIVYRAMEMMNEEMACLQKSAEISKRLGDNLNETKALLTLGYSARHLGDTSVALTAYQRILGISLETSDKHLEGRACANLGIVHHQMCDYEMALKLQAQCLKIALDNGDIGSQGRAYGNIGNACSALGLYDQAVKNHIKELEISSKIGDRNSECSTHGNLAVAYQALHEREKAQYHYNSQYDVARQIGNTTNEARALMNLGNHYNTLCQYSNAIEHYQKYLALLVQNPDKSGEGRALYNLGFACFSLHDYQQAVSCYEKSVLVATECQDKVAMARAYCNLGLAHKALGNLDVAFDCQNMFLSLSTELNSTRGTFKAFGNLGDIYIAKKEPEQAVGFYQQQLVFSEQHNEDTLVAQACASLGGVLRSIGQLDEALELHQKEAAIYAEVVRDSKNEYKAQGRLGATLTALERYHEALPCYERQLELSKTSKEPLTWAQACGNLAITYTNLEDFHRAKDCFQDQVDILQNIDSKSARLEKCKAHCNIGDCSAALEMFDEAISCHQLALSHAYEIKNLTLMERTCKGLSNSFRQVGKISDAITYSQKRLAICEQMGNSLATASTHEELGLMYSTIGKYNDAIYSLNQQMKVGVEINDENIKGDAACCLGGVYLLMKDYNKALTFHKLDLEIAQRNNNRPCQGRAYGNIAATYEAMGDFSSAIPSQEQHLFIAKEQNDEEAKLIALHGIGRNSLHLPSNDYSRSVLLLQQAMLLSHGVNNQDEMIMTLHDLGVAYWAAGDLDASLENFQKAADMAEKLCIEIFLAKRPDQKVFANSEAVVMYKVLVKCYSSLLCVLCQSGQQHDALVIAEKSRTFPERIFHSTNNFKERTMKITAHVTVDQILAYANKQDTIVVYYAITAGHLLQWFISPNGSITYAGHINLLSSNNAEGTSVLTEIIYELRKSLGVDTSDADTEDSDLSVSDNITSKDFSLFSYLVEIQESLHYVADHIKVNKGCLLSAVDCQSQDLENLKTKPPFYALYELLISKVESQVKQFAKQSTLSKLTLLVEGDLLLVPFCMLKKRSTDHFLSQNFIVTIAPSCYNLIRHQKDEVTIFDYTRGLVLGNPSVPSSVACDRWSASHASEEEANMVGGILRVEPFTGSSVNKDVALAHLGATEIAHFACNVSWKQPIGIVLGSDSFTEFAGHSQSPSETTVLESPLDFKAQTNSAELENFGEIILNDSDILSTDMRAMKLMVLGSTHLFKSSSSIASTAALSKSMSCLLRCFLCAGCKAVLTPMWPIPETASRLLLQTFYGYLLNGRCSTTALTAAMETLRGSQQFEHPSYWAGFLHIGQSSCVDARDLVTHHALLEVVQGNPFFAMDTLKLAVHLLEKSSQQTLVDSVESVPLYTSQQSVSTKLNNARGWRELFSAAGFELRPSCNGLPAAIFFPKPGSQELCHRVSKQISPYLNLPEEMLVDLGKLVPSPKTASILHEWIYQVFALRSNNNHSLNLTELSVIGRKIWQTDGVSQLLHSLGMMPYEMEDTQVTLYRKYHINSDTLSSLLDAMAYLFGEIGEGYAVNDNVGSDKATKSLKDLVVLSDPLHLQDLSKMVTRNTKKGMLSDNSGIMAGIDFNTSFHSMTSESSSHRIDSSEHSGQREEFGVLALEEPKIFTQVPSKTGLVAPTPVLPPNYDSSSPSRFVSSPSSAFTPSKKYQRMASSNGSFENMSPSSLISNGRSPMKSPWTPLTSPVHSPNKSPFTRSSPGGMFYQNLKKPEANVCAVMPKYENHSPSKKEEDKFISLFERMLTKDKLSDSETHPNKSLERGESSGLSVSAIQKISADDKDQNEENAHVISSPTTSAYKPAPSAASVCGIQPPGHEYSEIVDKFTHTPLSPLDDGYPLLHNKAIVSTVSTTHTAFRLVQSSDCQLFSAPKLQKYKVETQISQVSTLLSENNSLVQDALQSSASPESTSHGGKKIPKKSSAKSTLTSEKSCDIFQHLKSSNRAPADDRVQFV